MSKVFYLTGKSKKQTPAALPVKLFYIFTFTIFLVTPFPVFSQKIQISGFGEPGHAWNQNPPVPFSNQPVNEIFTILSDFMAGYGHYHCRVDSITFLSDSVLLWGDEGPISLCGPVSFSAPPAFPLPETGKLVTGSVFSQTVAEAYLIRLLSVATEAGFPFMTFRPEFRFRKVNEDTISVSILIQIEDTSRVRLSGITADGNKEVSTRVIERISRIRDGMVYSPETAAAIRSRLLASELFKSVSEPTFQITGENNYQWYVKVEEKPSSRFDGIIGYSPASPSKPASLNGLIDIRLKNFLGNARRLDLYWSREDKWSQEYRLNLAEPWILGFPIDLKLAAGQLNQDSTFIRQQYSGGIDYFGIDKLSISAGLETGFTTGLSNRLTRQTGPTVLNSRKLVFLTGITYDDRKGKSLVTNGHTVSATLGYGNKQITGPDSVVAVRSVRKSNPWLQVDATLSVWKPVGNQLIWYGSLRANHRSVEEPELSDLIRTGGINTMRGYRENQFLAIRQGILVNELRFPFEEESYLLAFLDAGYLVTPRIEKAGLKPTEMSVIGYGIGLMIRTPVGITRFLFALGKGDTFSTGKIHLGLMNEF